MRRAAALVLIGALVAWSAAACGDSYDEGAPVGGDGGGADGGDGAPLGPCDPSVVYVSSAGDDANDGCHSAKPRKTVTSAIGYAIAKNGGKAEIRLCAETLRERVVIGSATSIVGGFDCTSWAPGAGKTTIEAPSPDVVETVIAFGNGVPAETTLENLRIVGPKRPTGEVAALRFIGGASPTLRNSEVEGGTTEAGGSVTVGIEGSSPIIEDTQIKGGRGTCAAGCTTTTAIGVSVNGGRPRLNRLKIEGGTGTISVKSEGIGVISLDVRGDVKATGADAWTELEIVGGIGNVGGAYPVMGVRIGAGADVEIARSLIRSNDTSSACSTTPCFTLAAFAAAGTLRLRRCVASSFVAGPGAGAPTDLVVRENAATTVAGRFEARSSALYSRTGGLDILENGTLDVAASTIIGAELVSNAGGTADVKSSILVHTSLGQGTLDGQVAFSFIACPNIARTTLDHSVVVGSPAVFARYLSDFEQQSCSLGPMPAPTTLKDTAAASGGKTFFSATNVRRFAHSCTGEDPGTCTSVAACDPASSTYRDSCLVSVFASAAVPVKLKDGVACSIAQGGAAFADVLEDLEGHARTAPPSMGALEHDGPCSP